MKIFIVSLLLILSKTAHSQIKNLMNDQKVGWIAQGTTDLRFDLISDEDDQAIYSLTKNSPRPCDIIKLEEIKSNFKSDGNHHFAKILLDAIYHKKVKTYSDSTCTKEINITSLNTDSIYVIDPVTFEEKLTVVHNKFEPEQAVLFRVFQTYIYKPEKGIWEVKVESIAPLFLKTENHCAYALKPLFWIKTDFNNRPSDKKFKLEN